MSDTEEFEEWFRRGLRKGWITAPFCANHDGPPLAKDETDEDRWDDDWCIYCVRLLG